MNTGTQAITIAAPAFTVWPWVEQIGRGRGGFYTYTWLENLLGADIHNLDRIDPTLQPLAPGDRVWLTPDPYLGRIPGQYWTVQELRRNSHLVMLQQPPGNPLRGSWALVLRPEGPTGGSTRVLSRTWGEPSTAFARRLLSGFWSLGNRLMVRGMLRGLKRRAEQPGPTDLDRTIVSRVRIDRPPDQVFAHLADVRQELQWNDQLLDAVPLTDGPLQAGSQYRVRFAGPVGESLITYHEVKSPAWWRTSSHSRLLRVRFTGRIDRRGDGSDVTLRTTLIPRGPLRPLAPLLRRVMATSWEHHLATVKRQLEASTDRPG